MTLTDFVIIFLILQFLGYEGWTLINKTKNDTVSHRVVTWCRRYPWIALIILGFMVALAGHFFMPYDRPWIWRQPVFEEITP